MTTRPRPLPAHERRAAAVAAVIELATDRDPAEITTTVIANHMGLTQGALFKHFPTKESIQEAVIAWVADRLVTLMDAADQEGSSSRATLERMFLEHTSFIAQHPGVPRIMFGELQRSGSTAPKRIAIKLLRQYSRRLHGWLESGRDRDELDTGLDLEMAAAMFVGTIQGLVMQAMIAGNVSRIRRDAPRAFAIYLRGISRGQP